MRQADLRALAAKVTERQPVTLASDRRAAIIRARDSADLASCRDALVLGRLHVCCNCTAFAFGNDPAGLGRCQRFSVDTAPFVPFWCAGFEPSRRAVTPDYLPDPDGVRARAKEYSR
jgi:hypothetical protein